MRPWKGASYLLAFLAVASLAFGVGSFSAVDANRQVSVTVVDDSEAYLGITGGGSIETEGGTTTLYTITNQFPVTIDVAASAANEDVTVSGIQDLQPGESADLTAEIDCTGNWEADVAVTLDATGTDTRMTKTKTVRITCTTGGSTATSDSTQTSTVGDYTVHFSGCGSAYLTSESADAFPVTVGLEVNDGRTDEDRRLTEGETIQDVGGPLTGLYITHLDQTAKNPNQCTA